jgi:hypothetical protein
MTDAILRRWDPGHWADWMVPLVAAAVWSLVMFAAVDAGAGMRRSLVFVGGPLLLLAGLHARISGYLHAPSRQILLVLPLSPRQHFEAARRRHLVGLAATLGLGSAAVVVGTFTSGTFTSVEIGLVLDWAALAVLAFAVEPMIPAVSAWLGRRFDNDSTAKEWQLRLGGGWTLPEAVVHLYAPALGIGAAAALAMPAQLGIDRSVDALPVPPWLWAAAGIAAGLGVVSFAVAPRVYARGVFEAVPFVAEATRTLAGPPVPESTPGFIARMKDPVLRLLVLQFWRETPLPSLRLLAVVGAAAWVALTTAPTAPHAALLLAACLLWLVPAGTLARARAARTRFLATLPLPERQRDGGHPIAAALLWAPPATAVAVLALRIGGGW